MTDLQTQLLIAARESAQAFVMAVDALIDEIANPAALTCEHPEEQRAFHSGTFGNPKYICNVCKTIIEPENA